MGLVIAAVFFIRCRVATNMCGGWWCLSPMKSMAGPGWRMSADFLFYRGNYGDGASLRIQGPRWALLRRKTTLDHAGGRVSPARRLTANGCLSVLKIMSILFQERVDLLLTSFPPTPPNAFPDQCILCLSRDSLLRPCPLFPDLAETEICCSRPCRRGCKRDHQQPPAPLASFRAYRRPARLARAYPQPTRGGGVPTFSRQTRGPRRPR